MHSNTIKSSARIAIIAGLILSLSCLKLEAQGFLNNNYNYFCERIPPYPTNSSDPDNYIYIGTGSDCYNYMRSLKIYDNFCLNHEPRYSIEGDCFGLLVLGRFSIPNTRYRMILACADYAEFSSSGLFLSDANGNQLDFLACENDSDRIVVKQYLIDSNYDITIYTLVPDSGDISMMDVYDKVTSFKAHRVDQTYRVTNGHFALIKTVTYQSKTYYNSMFLDNSPSYDKRYRIRLGNEVVAQEPNNTTKNEIKEDRIPQELLHKFELRAR